MTLAAVSFEAATGPEGVEVDLAELLLIKDFLVMDIVVPPGKNFELLQTPSVLHPACQTSARNRKISQHDDFKGF
jgi:hypothetical protein